MTRLTNENMIMFSFFKLYRESSKLARTQGANFGKVPLTLLQILP
jgi:hypothetical protein